MAIPRRRQSSRPPLRSEPPRTAGPAAVVLLGAQRFARSLGATVDALGARGRAAVITCGWQEREAEDGELSEHLGGDTINLRLHGRAEELFAADPLLAAAHRKRQEMLRFKQDFYRVRIEHALSAHHVIRQRAAPAEVLAEEETASIAAIRALDGYHLDECARLHADFELAMRPAERPHVIRMREAIARELSDCRALCIAGGNVATLVNRLRLFGIVECCAGLAVFAWAGGAMAACERIVLFHDNTPEGPVAPELLDRGIGLVPDLVALPEPERRLSLQASERVRVMAKRFAPARVLAFPAGAHLTWRDGQLMRPANVIELRANGQARPFEESA